MALPSSGTMKASMIREELKETGTWSINAKSSRDLAKVPSGMIKFSDFYGKTFSKANKMTILDILDTGFYWGWGMREDGPRKIVGDTSITVNNGQILTFFKSTAYADETSAGYLFYAKIDWSELSRNIIFCDIKVTMVSPNGYRFVETKKSRLFLAVQSNSQEMYISGNPYNLSIENHPELNASSEFIQMINNTTQYGRIDLGLEMEVTVLDYSESEYYLHNNGGTHYYLQHKCYVDNDQVTYGGIVTNSYEKNILVVTDDAGSIVFGEISCDCGAQTYDAWIEYNSNVDQYAYDIRFGLSDNRGTGIIWGKWKYLADLENNMLGNKIMFADSNDYNDPFVDRVITVTGSNQNRWYWYVYVELRPTV